MTEDVKCGCECTEKLKYSTQNKTTVSSTTAGGKAKAVQVEVRKNALCQQMLREKPLRQKN